MSSHSPHSRKAARLITATRRAEREAAFRAESTQILASALGLVYLANALVGGAALYHWRGWTAVFIGIGVLLVIAVASILGRARRAVRRRDGLRDRR